MDEDDPVDFPEKGDFKDERFLARCALAVVMGVGRCRTRLRDASDDPPSLPFIISRLFCATNLQNKINTYASARCATNKTYMSQKYLFIFFKNIRDFPNKQKTFRWNECGATLPYFPHHPSTIFKIVKGSACVIALLLLLHS